MPEAAEASGPGPVKDETRDGGRERPLLLFFECRTSGPARRMQSLVAHYARKERTRLRVVRVDADENLPLVERLKVDEIPSLVLIKDRRLVGRLCGRATGEEIEELIRAHVA
ncbi:MAG: thioredoxin family protein [Gaiellaceae bacterium]